MGFSKFNVHSKNVDSTKSELNMLKPGNKKSSFIIPKFKIDLKPIDISTHSFQSALSKTNSCNFNSLTELSNNHLQNINSGHSKNFIKQSLYGGDRSKDIHEMTKNVSQIHLSSDETDSTKSDVHNNMLRLMNLDLKNSPPSTSSTGVQNDVIDFTKAIRNIHNVLKVKGENQNNQNEIFDIPFIDCDVVPTKYTKKDEYYTTDLVFSMKGQCLHMKKVSNFGTVLCCKYTRKKTTDLICGSDMNTVAKKRNRFFFNTLSPDDIISKRLKL